MSELGLFPLGLVLLPGERIPLHIFEPRYRELIGECLDEEREFGLLFADDDGLREVGTRAAVVAVLERFDDGRLNVVVEGRERFRVVRPTAGRSFSTADVEPLADDGGAPDDASVERAVVLLRRIAGLAGASVDDLAPGATPSFALAGRIELDPGVKQELLESRSEPERLERVTVLLEGAAETLETRALRRGVIETNGHLPHELRRDD